MRVTYSVDDTAMEAAALELQLERGLRHERFASWRTAAATMPPLGEVVASRDATDGLTRVVRRADGVVRLRLHRGWAHAHVSAATLGDLEDLTAIVRHQLPERADEPDGEDVSMTFWANGTIEPEPTTRRLEVPSWAEVAANYPNGTREELGRLMTTAPPLAGGRLVLWHGPPGTGKTSAIKALAREWRDAAEVHCVTDPEELLGDPSYLQALLGGTPRDRWRLLVLEDAGELLLPDAKERAGQGLARLLNVTDGLAGHGLRTLVLITGNEPLDRLHPAVARPGRCAAEIHFGRFTGEEAQAWLDARQDDPDLVFDQPTLAELYARLEGRSAPTTSRSIGFTAR